jgi:hypothetical protein
MSVISHFQAVVWHVGYCKKHANAGGKEMPAPSRVEDVESCREHFHFQLFKVTVTSCAHMQMVLSVRERSWWSLTVPLAHCTLLLQSMAHACRLLGRQVRAHDVLNIACLWVVTEADSNTLFGIDLVASMHHLGLDASSCDSQIGMLQDIAEWSRTVGPIV